MARRRLTILGSTGSIGKSTLDLVRRNPDQFDVIALTANTNARTLASQAIEFNAKFVALADPNRVDELVEALEGFNVEFGVGPRALIEAAKREADFCMAAIIGAAGLPPTLAAVEQGIHIGLANKECLVCGGDLFMRLIETSGATLLPVDSEHNAIFQVLEQDNPAGVRRLILTASGGPFRETSLKDLKNVTREQALNHPVWSMGAKITVDSASLMNKGLELIEASYLFNRPSADIDVIIHPQSIVHSLVEYVDGSLLAQLGSPDMRTPIAYALGWPKRMQAPVKRLSLETMSDLSFFKPDLERFPALRIAREALEAGGAVPNILNAANEVAVEAFLNNRLKFSDIATLSERTIEIESQSNGIFSKQFNLDDIIATDESARRTASNLIKAL